MPKSGQKQRSNRIDRLLLLMLEVAALTGGDQVLSDPHVLNRLKPRLVSHLSEIRKEFKSADLDGDWTHPVL